MMQQKLILIGDSAFAEVAFEYFTHDSPYEAVAFAVERQFRKHDELCGLPVIDLEDVAIQYPPSGHVFHVAVAYNQMNRVRAKLIQTMCDKGYEPVSYISSDAKVWPSARIGRHCFIFENNVIQPHAVIGDNCVLWSGNHIGHHSRIGNSCFIASQVVISGCANISDNCFWGVNSTILNNLTVGRDCLIGAGATVTRSLEADTVLRPAKGYQSPGAKLLMGVEE